MNFEVLSLAFGSMNNFDASRVLGSLHGGLRQPGKCLKHGIYRRHTSRCFRGWIVQVVRQYAGVPYIICTYIKRVVGND